MKRIAATAIVAVGVLQMSSANSQTSGSGAVTDSAAAISEDAAASAAGDLARTEAARRLKMAAGEFKVMSVTPTQWSDSSLGCRRPGVMYAQVITAGYAVMLERQGRRHQVNVAGEHAAMCDSLTRAGVRQPMPARGLEQMTELARHDLARRLQLDPSHVRIAQIEPQRWTDADMNCGASAVPAPAASIVGFRLALTASDRTYVYHTDLKTVRPCPPIEDR